MIMPRRATQSHTKINTPVIETQSCTLQVNEMLMILCFEMFKTDTNIGVRDWFCSGRGGGGGGLRSRVDLPENRHLKNSMQPPSHLPPPPPPPCLVRLCVLTIKLHALQRHWYFTIFFGGNTVTHSYSNVEITFHLLS